MKNSKKKVKLNAFTGLPRKWVCGNCRWLDEELQLIEARYQQYLGMELPLPVLSAMVTEADRIAKDARLRLDKSLSDDSPTLTQAQLDYCEAEAIPPEEFILRAKR